MNEYDYHFEIEFDTRVANPKNGWLDEVDMPGYVRWMRLENIGQRFVKSMLIPYWKYSVHFWSLP